MKQLNTDEDVNVVVKKMNNYFNQEAYKSFELVVVPSHYYDETLEWRSAQLKAPSIQYLCKTILMENTVYDDTQKSPLYPKYVCIVIQYVTKINADKVMKWARKLNQQKLGKNKFHFRLVHEDTAFELTGYRYNSLTPYLMNQSIPLLISDKISKLPGQFFWLGGGHVDIKLRLGLQECVDKYPGSVHFADITMDQES